MKKQILILLGLLVLCFSKLYAINDTTILIIGGDKNHYPYEFIDEQGKASGFNIDIIEAVAKEIGIDYKIELRVWQKSRDMLKRGELDMLCMYYSTMRDKDYDFSTPFITITNSVFVNKGSSIKSIDDIIGKKIIVERGDMMHDYVIEKKLTDSLILADDQKDALLLLETGKYDCALLSSLQSLHIIDNKKIKNVKSVGEAIFPSKYCFAVKNNNSVLLAKLNEGLKLIKEKGIYDDIYIKWFGVPKPTFDYKEYLNYIFIGLLIIIMIIGGVIFWIYFLRKKVAEKTDELTGSVKKYRQLVEQSGQIMYDYEVDGGAISWSGDIEAITGYTVKEFSGIDIEEWEKHVHPEDVDEIMDMLFEAQRKCAAYHAVYRFRRKDDSYIYLKDDGIFFPDEKGHAVTMIGIMKDINEQMLADKKLYENEQKFRTLTETLPVGVILYQKNKFVYVNPSIERISGYSRKELLNMNFWDVVHPDYRDMIIDRGQKRQKGDKNVVKRYEFKIIAKDGTEKWVYFSGSSINYKNSTAAISSIIDITQNKKNENELINREKRLRSYFSNAMIGVAITSVDKGWLEINSTVSNILGYSFAELSKSSWEEITYPDDLKEDNELFGQMLANKIDSYTIEKRFIRKDNEIVWTKMNISCVRNEDDTVSYVIALLEDISELVQYRTNLENIVEERTKELEKTQKSLTYLLEDVKDINIDLKNANTNLFATNKELESFSYSVSHDLRAPLTRMDGFSKVLLDLYENELDEKAVHYLHRIRSSAVNMKDLINALLSLSRLTRSVISREQVDITALCYEVKNELEDNEPDRKVFFNIEDGLIRIGDKKFIKILLDNLIGNAFKFTANSDTATITIGSTIKNEKNVLFIKDNGVGFNMKYYNKIFTAFQRLHSERDFKGTGIGLAIVQRVINKHGGEIWGESEEGKGTSFYFTFE